MQNVTCFLEFFSFWKIPDTGLTWRSGILFKKYFEKYKMLGKITDCIPQPHVFMQSFNFPSTGGDPLPVHKELIMYVHRSSQSLQRCSLYSKNNRNSLIHRHFIVTESMILMFSNY